MKILYLSQYFPPEMGAPSARVSELSKYWARAGYEVTVLTAFPHHPTGIKPLRYRRRLIMHEEYNGIKVLRAYVYATPNKGFRRILSYASFMFSSIIIGALFAPKPDVLIATSPQFLVAIAGYVLSKLKRCAFVMEVRDLWPRGIVEVGAMKENFLTRILEKIEIFLYRNADIVITVTQGMKRDIQQRGNIPESKIFVVPNGAEGLAMPADAKNIRSDLSLNDKFVVSYIGTIGLTQGLTTVMESARALREHPNIAFLLVGEGAQKENLIAVKKSYGLNNVIFLPEQRREEIGKYYALSDAVIVHLRRLPLFKITVPSKLFEAMSAGKPILIGVDGEAREIAEKAECGYFFEPENSAELTEAILKLFNDKERARKMGASGKEFVRKHYNRAEQARQYAEILEKFKL